jgi:helix-turn-helix protein
MSIRVMNRVWEHSEQKEGTLLVLLALADYADDNGVCWPAQPEIAKKARLTDRQIRNVLKGLVDGGDLLFVPSKGRGRPAVYCVLTGLPDTDRTQRRKWFHGKYFQENTSAFTEETRKLATQKAEIGDTKGGNQLHTKYQPNGATESTEPSISENDNRHGSVMDPSEGVIPTPAREQKQPDDLALAIAGACKINPKIATKRQREQLNEAYQSLKAISATPADVQQRADWWPNDWRAKKENRPPRPMELVEIWEAATVPVKQPNGQRSPPDLPMVTAPAHGAKQYPTAAERRKIIEASDAKARGE